MEDFDIQINMNGDATELVEFAGESAKDLWGRKKINPKTELISKAENKTLAKLSRFEGDFDLEVGFDGDIQFEPTSNAQGNTLNQGQSNVNRVQGRDTRMGQSNVKVDVVRGDIKPVQLAISKEIVKSRFEGEPTTDNEPKKNWIDTLNTLTEDFKEITDFKTNEQAQADKEQEIAEKGTKYTILGMNPFVAIGISLVVIIGGSYALTKIKAG